ncbi:MAG: hypothetical protein WBG54_01335 [Acidobacteriaceae bacterium]
MRCRIEAASDCQEASALLERFISPLSARLADLADEPDLRMRVERAGDDFQLFVNDSLRASAGQPERLVPELVRTLDDAVIHHLNGLWAVHAGVVQWGERALLLPGRSHAGKSTLVAELLRRGATYFSDEYALIDREGRVHPYPRPLLVRNGEPEQHPVLAEEFGASTGTLPASLGWILSLTYQPDEAWKIDAIPQSAALVNLLQNTPHVLEETPALIGVFERAVAGAQCWAGCRADAKSAAVSILELIGARAA